MISLTLDIGDGVELRHIAEGDAEELTALVDRNRSYLREWLPWLEHSRSVADTARFIERSVAQAQDENGYTFGIVSSGILAGVIGQHFLDSMNQKTELGYWLDAGHQGRGLVTRAAGRLTDYSLNDQGCNRVVLNCAVGNAKSRAIAERLGFVQEGILREAEWLYDHFVDLVVYSMLKRDWHTPREWKKKNASESV